MPRRLEGAQGQPTAFPGHRATGRIARGSCRRACTGQARTIDIMESLRLRSMTLLGLFEAFSDRGQGCLDAIESHARRTHRILEQRGVRSGSVQPMRPKHWPGGSYRPVAASSHRHLEIQEAVSITTGAPTPKPTDRSSIPFSWSSRSWGLGLPSPRAYSADPHVSPGAMTGTTESSNGTCILFEYKVGAVATGLTE